MTNHQYEPYDALASIYDHWQKNFTRPYFKIVCNQLKKEIRRYRIQPGRFLDLACGTGDAAIFMAKQGWQVTGVDSSSKMLQQAELKAARETENVTFLQQRLQELNLKSTFQMAGSFYDCLNHITSKRTLQKALKQIRKHLDDESLFVFDSNTLSCYRNLWNTTSVGHEEEYTVIMENRFDEPTGNAFSNITVFEREKGSSYGKKVAQVHERLYTNEELEYILYRAGFEVMRRDPLYLFTYNEPDPYKQWWVCNTV